ncbi:MAG: VanZ family protein, partial [Thermoanaerobaculia bacterium]
MPAPRSVAIHLLSLAVAAAIAFGLIEPVPPRIEAVSHEIAFPIDKLAHFGLFLIAAFPWRRSFALMGLRSPGIAVVAVAAVYGGLLEIAQGLWTVRDPEVLDMVAGALGAAAAV